MPRSPLFLSRSKILFEMYSFLVLARRGRFCYSLGRKTLVKAWPGSVRSLVDATCGSVAPPAINRWIVSYERRAVWLEVGAWWNENGNRRKLGKHKKQACFKTSWGHGWMACPQATTAMIPKAAKVSKLRLWCGVWCARGVVAVCSDIFLSPYLYGTWYILLSVPLILVHILSSNKYPDRIPYCCTLYVVCY